MIIILKKQLIDLLCEIMKKNIPHIITLSSLCIAILSIIESCKFNLTTSSFLILFCFVLDALDGSLARLLKVESEYGKQLDSFSDMIAFGVAPGILIFNFINIEFNNPPLAYLSLLIPICSALRLGRYNIKTDKKEGFIGLTTPASAIVFTSIPLIKQYETNTTLIQFFINEYTITFMIIFISILLISQLQTFSLRLKLILENKRKLGFIFISTFMLYIFKFSALPIIIFMYIIISFLYFINN